MCVFILGLFAIFILMSFILAMYSIKAQYMGALACWTVCVTPLGVGLDLVLNSSVKKSQAENTGASGEGVKYLAALRGEETI